MPGAAIIMRGGVQPQSTLADPMRVLNEAMTLRNTQMEFAARGRAGSIISQFPNDPAAASRALQSDPLVSGYYPDAINLQRSLQLMQAETQLQQTRMQGEQASQARDAYADVIEGTVAAANDPTQLVPGIMSRLAKYPVALQERIMPSLQIYLQSLNHGLDFSMSPSDPRYAQNLKTYQGRLFGQLVSVGKPDMMYQAMGIAPPTLEAAIPLPGGGTQPGYLGGAPWLYGPGVTAPGEIPTGGAPPPPPINLTPGAPPPPPPPADTGVAPHPAAGASGAAAAPVPPPEYPGIRGAGGPATFSTSQTAQWNQLTDQQTQLNQQVNSGMQLNQNINEARKLLKEFHAGPLAKFRNDAASFAIDLGADPATIEAIAGAPNSVAAYQEFSKLVYNQLMNQLAGSMPPGARLNLQEYTDASRANPNPAMQAQAIEHIFNFWQRSFIQSRMEQRFLTDYIREHQRDPDAAGLWASYWQGLRERKKLLDPDYLTADGKRGIPPESIIKLLGNDDPQSRAAFDKVYGKGSAARFLDEGG